MIVPVVGLDYYKFKKPKFKDHVVIIKEKDNPYDKHALAVHNKSGQQIGYVAKRNDYNKQLYAEMLDEHCFGNIFVVYPKQILIEIVDFTK